MSIIMNINFNKIENITSIYKRRGKRLLITATYNISNRNISEKVYIDAKLGDPSWKQMMDATFGPGAKCGLRIIIFGGGRGDELGCDPEMAINFAEINNLCGLPTCLVSLEPFVQKGDVGYEFAAMGRPLKVYGKAPSQLPSKVEFERAEYWVCYHYYLSLVHAVIQSNIDWWFDYKFSEKLDGIGYTSTWTEEGFFIDVTAQDKDDKHLMEWLWMTRRAEIEQTNCDVKIKREDDKKKPITLSVKILDTPFCDFNKLSLSRKKDIADHIYDAGTDISSLFDKQLE